MTRPVWKIAVAASVALLGGAAAAKTTRPLSIQTVPETLLKAGAYYVSLQGTCQTDGQHAIYHGDQMGENALKDVDVIKSSSGKLPTTSDIKQLRTDLCDYYSISFPSRADQRRTYIFMSLRENFLRRYFGWSELEVPEREFQAFARAHEIGHALVDRVRLAKIARINLNTNFENPIEEAVADSFATCWAFSTNEAKLDTIKAFLQIRVALAQKDSVHANAKFFNQAVVNELQQACTPARPQRNANEKTVFKTAAGIFLKHFTRQ